MIEPRTERTADGKLLFWLFDSGDRNLLRRCSECLVGELGAQPTERFDGMDQIFLDFILAGIPLALQWAHGRGIAVSSLEGSKAAEALTERVARHLIQHVTP